MANEEHLEVIREYAVGYPNGHSLFGERDRRLIDRWREDNPDVVLDLARANLEDMYLAGANLAGAKLSFAKLVGVDLYGAILVGANLEDANLKDADLSHAYMTGVKGLTAHQLAQARNIEHAYLEPGRYADAVAAGYKPADD